MTPRVAKKQLGLEQYNTILPEICFVDNSSDSETNNENLSFEYLDTDVAGSDTFASQRGSRFHGN